MSNIKDKTQRRVYVLPVELVERIEKFRNSLNLASEVEAVRRLLDEALNQRESVTDLAERFISEINRRGGFDKHVELADIAKDVIVGHPKVQSLNIEDDYIEFQTRDGSTARIASMEDMNGNVAKVKTKRGFNGEPWDIDIGADGSWTSGE